MDDWSNDLTPEPASLPPPKMMDLSTNEIWDADQSSLPSLPPDETATFSSGSSLRARVLTNLQTSVPKHVISRRSQHIEPLESPRYQSAIPKPTRSRSAKRTAVPREIKLDHHLEKLRGELEEANATIEKLKQEPREELTRLHKTFEVLSASNTRLTDEAKALQMKLSEEATKCSNMETSLQNAQDSYAAVKTELRACHDELETTQSAMAEQEQTVDECNTKCEELEGQLTEQSSRESQTLQGMRHSNNELSMKAKNVDGQNKELRKQAEESILALDLKCKECLDLIQERAVLRGRLERPASHEISVQTDSVDMRCIEVQTDSTSEQAGNPPPNSILTERLTRIREATERTGLLRQHQDEVAGLTEDHEQTIRGMERRHSQRLREFEEQTTEEHTSKLQQVRRSLQSEHQKRLDEMEKRHRTELSKERSERGRKLGMTTESLETALAEVAVATQQLEEESRARVGAEANLEQRISYYEHEKISLVAQFEHEVGTLRVTWEDERASLLDDIQAGCNQVFLDSRRLLLPSPTKNVDFALLKEVRAPVLQNLSPSNLSSTQSPTSQFEFDWSKDEDASPRRKIAPNSTTATSVSQSLAETEAFVLKVLGGTCL